jgi:hypothetical protein
MPAAPAAAASVNAISPSPPSTYQVRYPPVTAATASSCACWPATASKTAAASALRCTGPMVSSGRSGP